MTDNITVPYACFDELGVVVKSPILFGIYTIRPLIKEIPILLK